ncbi:MAG: hypothetical protein LBU88_06610 [Treponema sp.]|jgi:hypothetical protein|nr:hypothetical protein [Treponema sp.]
MNRIGLALILIIFAVFIVHGQNQSSSPIDLVLLLDTSTGMSSSYDNVNNYITGGFLTEFLRVGDTFHLISFSQAPKLDVARRISATGDVETIIGRMMLQYPIERGSNIQAALTYVEQYVSALPSRPKKIVLVSTGTNDTANLVAASSQRLSSRNTTIDFVRVTPGQPITNVPSSGRAQPQRQGAADIARQPGTADTLRGDQGFTAGQGVADSTTPGAGVTGDSWSTADGRITDGIADGRTTTDGWSLDGTGTTEDRIAADGIAVDTEGTETDSWSTTLPAPDSLSEKSGVFNFSSSLPWIIGLILLLLLIIGIIILLSSRRLGSSPNRVMAQVASGGHDGTRERVDHSKDLARYAAGQSRRTTPYSDRPYKPDTAAPVVINPHGPLLLNLFVEDQNTRIGKRNIHSLKSGYNLSVGGGKADGFLIFLVPIPPHIGELRRSGSQLSFIPKKARYFPDLGSNELRDCLNKTIRIISDKNYELRFRFEMYEDPLVTLNRMLNSIKVPG